MNPLSCFRHSVLTSKVRGASLPPPAPGYAARSANPHRRWLRRSLMQTSSTEMPSTEAAKYTTAWSNATHFGPGYYYRPGPVLQKQTLVLGDVGPQDEHVPKKPVRNPLICLPLHLRAS